MIDERVTFYSSGDEVVGVLFSPEIATPLPALIICHGALEFKENFFELSEYLVKRGMAVLAIDMHGHGESRGERFHVNMSEWVADIQAAIMFLESRAEVDSNRIGAFGFSSGGTAVLEAGVVGVSLKVIITLDGTVRNTMGCVETVGFQVLNLVGKVKRALTKQDLRLSLARMAQTIPFASDPQVNSAFISDQRLIEGYSAFPLPGAAQCFFVDTLQRVGSIAVPTLVLHGQEDKVDPPETAQLLYDALTCEKRLEIIPSSGHVGHLDKQKDRVMELTAEWALRHLT